jgi:formate dehydrogenase subunit gamma
MALLRLVRCVVLTLSLLIVLPTLAGAQQVNPTAESVREEQLLQQNVKRITGECSIPDQKACTLEQLRGRDWRYLYQTVLRLVGAGAILGLIAVVLVIYFVRGTVRIEHGRSGRKMVSFSAFERFVHWLATTCFIILALTGLNITFGKELLLPLIGPDAFAAISRWGKYAHNYLSFPFTLSVLLMVPLWIHWNLPTRFDLQWMLEGGGFGKTHPPTDRFNAGQKSIYWVVVLGGLLVAASGYLLMFPFYGTGIAAMQLGQLVHGAVGLLYIAALVFHIYMATVGEEGAFESMWDGVVDENWAKQNHSVWYEREVGKGNVAKVPAEGELRPDAKPSTDGTLRPARG